MMLAFTLIGLGAAAAMVAGLAWSIRNPGRAVWPPRAYRPGLAILAWALTLGLFGAALALGILGWGGLGLPVWLRVAGAVLVVLANAAAWIEALRLGLKATSGGGSQLHTGGLYRWSRNPQYVADIVILVGWVLLSASLAAVPVVLAGIAVFLLAPLAEEPWLEARYGAEYEAYRGRVRRFL